MSMRRAGDPEVRDLDMVARVDDHVVRLEVTVDDARRCANRAASTSGS